MDCQITWYGRCCFLVVVDGVKVLFDPYDRFCSVDIGFISADIVLSSSTWHDHGHIGASPQAHIFSYAGEYMYKDLRITGIEAKENRGTPTVVFTLQSADLTITNFADLGAAMDHEFAQSLTTVQNDLLRSTTVAFLRANPENQNALRYCQPRYIIPEHYIPSSFLSPEIPPDESEKFAQQNIVVDRMEQTLLLPVERIVDYSVRLSTDHFKTTPTILRFMKMHPQVRYVALPKRSTFTRASTYARNHYDQQI